MAAYELRIPAYGWGRLWFKPATLYRIPSTKKIRFSKTALSPTVSISE